MYYDEKIRIVRNWSYSLEIREDDNGHLYARIQFGAHQSFGHYTGIHTFHEDLIDNLYQMTYDVISEGIVLIDNDYIDN